jgi:hypothetical protein
MMSRAESPSPQSPFAIHQILSRRMIFATSDEMSASIDSIATYVPDRRFSASRRRDAAL